jgi:hypothetical protein
MAEYTNEQLLKLLEEQGADTKQFGRQLSGTESVGGKSITIPQPIEIMNMAGVLGVVVTWAEIVGFLLCVAKGCWTKPLPDAINDCK